MTKLRHFEKHSVVPMPAHGSWPASNYIFCNKSVYALEMALATGRPLLVKGEPGIGKSHLARAAAVVLERHFISEVININTESQDLLWRMDLVSRLNDAQAGKESINIEQYISPGILWWAFNREEAIKFISEGNGFNIFGSEYGDEETPLTPSKGVVLLIDEIDKADPSLPNSLLEVLGNGGFTIPPINKVIQSDSQAERPLVIITTNDERELPPAFLRRCLVLNLSIDENNISGWLKKRARVHYTEAQCSDKILDEAAEQLIRDRAQAASVKPGLAEYLDLLCALNEMTKDTAPEKREQAQSELLQHIQKFVLNKAD